MAAKSPKTSDWTGSAGGAGDPPPAGAPPRRSSLFDAVGTTWAKAAAGAFLALLGFMLLRGRWRLAKIVLGVALALLERWSEERISVTVRTHLDRAGGSASAGDTQSGGPSTLRNHPSQGPA